MTALLIFFTIHSNGTLRSLYLDLRTAAEARTGIEIRTIGRDLFLSLIFLVATQFHAAYSHECHDNTHTHIIRAR